MPIWRIAWRNLWRNRRRTWLTSGGIAFAVLLLEFSMAMQDGGFALMIDNGARLLTGHVQLQHPEYRDDPRLEHTLTGVAALRELALRHPGVQYAAPRATAFALASSGERSFGAQVVGVDPGAERAWSTLPGMVAAGRYLEAAGEAYVGVRLARNLGLDVGAELILLGNAREGGVAAHVARVVGTFDTGQPALDRAVAHIPIGDFRAAWNLGPDEAHVIAMMAVDVLTSERVAPALAGPGRVSLDWTQLMPEAEQTVELKYAGAQLFFALVTVIVTFSVVNTFMMTVFERTPELGMLMAIGMRPRAIIAELQVEALWLCVLGVTLGLGIASLAIAVLGQTGMPLPGAAEEVMARYNMPNTLYPAFSVQAAIVGSLVMLLGTQLAAIVPALRVRRMRPVDALRARE